MYKIFSALTALAAVAVATPAFAQDNQADPSVGGFRAEIHSGWDRVNVDGGYGGKSGVNYGLGLGYDYAVTENFFIGVEGNVDDSSTKACVDSLVVVGDRACVKSGVDLSAGIRVGFASLGGKLYVLGGYTNAHVKATYDDGVSVSSIGDNLDGWRVGAGYQYTFTNGVYIKAEYRFSDYQGGFERHNIIGGVGYQF